MTKPEALALSNAMNCAEWEISVLNHTLLEHDHDKEYVKAEKILNTRHLLVDRIVDLATSHVYYSNGVYTGLYSKRTLKDIKRVDKGWLRNRVTEILIGFGY